MKYTTSTSTMTSTTTTITMTRHSNGKRPPLSAPQQTMMLLFKVSFLLVITMGFTCSSGYPTISKNQQQQRRTNDDNKHITIASNDDVSSDGQSALLHYQAQNTDGYYKFGYANPDGQYRVEEGSPDEGIIGSYGYVGTDGRDIKVYYSAGVGGFRIISPGLYKVMLSRRIKKLLDVPGELIPSVEIEPYEPEVESYGQEAERKPIQKLFEIQPTIKPAPFRFVSYRTAGFIEHQPPSTVTTTTTTTEIPTTTTTTTTTPSPSTTTAKATETPPPSLKLEDLPNEFHTPQSQFVTSPYHPYLSLNNNNAFVNWRLPQQVSKPYWNQGGTIGAPVPVYYHPQFGIQPIPFTFTNPPSLPRFEQSVQPPIVIKI